MKLNTPRRIGWALFGAVSLWLAVLSAAALLVRSCQS